MGSSKRRAPVAVRMRANDRDVRPAVLKLNTCFNPLGRRLIEQQAG